MNDLTQKAYEDLKEIAIYTQKTWGKSQRMIYLKMIDEAFNVLSRKSIFWNAWQEKILAPKNEPILTKKLVFLTNNPNTRS